MAEEIAVAERHGMFFPVGDTTGAPGLVRGLRADPARSQAILDRIPAGRWGTPDDLKAAAVFLKRV